MTVCVKRSLLVVLLTVALVITMMPFTAFSSYAAQGYEVMAASDETGKTDISTCRVSSMGTMYVFTGTAIVPNVVVKDPNEGNKILTKGVDYTVAVTDNINCGTASVVISGMGDYQGTLTKRFSIIKRGISDATIADVEKTYEYTGAQIRPDLRVIVEKTELQPGRDYTVSYGANTNVGTGTITIAGNGNYESIRTLSFTITPKEITAADVSGVDEEYLYTGAAITPNVSVNGLTKGTDYTVSYSNNVNEGTASVKVTGINNCTGTVTKTFRIVKPLDVTIPGSGTEPNPGTEPEQTIFPDNRKIVNYAGNNAQFDNTIAVDKDGNIQYISNKGNPYVAKATGGPGYILVNWNDCVKQNGADIDGYMILKKTSTESTYKVYKYVSNTTLSVTDTSVSKNVIYGYLVCGYKNVQVGNLTLKMPSNAQFSCMGVTSDSTKKNTYYTGTKISKTELTLTVGKTSQLSMIYNTGAFSTWTRWRTDNAKVAKVSSTGVVTAVGEGSCYITARSPNGYDYRCLVTVK